MFPKKANDASSEKRYSEPRILTLDFAAVDDGKVARTGMCLRLPASSSGKLFLVLALDGDEG